MTIEDITLTMLVLEVNSILENVKEVKLQKHQNLYLHLKVQIV